MFEFSNINYIKNVNYSLMRLIFLKIYIYEDLIKDNEQEQTPKLLEEL